LAGFLVIYLLCLIVTFLVMLFGNGYEAADWCAG